MRRARSTARKLLGPASCLVLCDSTGILFILLMDSMASLVLWFGLDDWVIGQINREATRTLMPSPSV